jgi:hypothetical protein
LGADAQVQRPQLVSPKLDLERESSAQINHHQNGHGRASRGQDSPFPTSNFEFSLGAYDGLFGGSASAQDVNVSNAGGIPFPRHVQGIQQTMDPYSPVDDQGNEGGLHTVSSSDSFGSNILPFFYSSSYDTNPTPFSQQQQQQQYTHVNPTQLIASSDGNGRSGGVAFHPSPSSDGWGSGKGDWNTSSTASPEPFVVSEGSTPPSTSNESSTASGRSGTAAPGPASSKKLQGVGANGQKKKGAIAGVNVPRQAALRGSSSPEVNNSSTNPSNTASDSGPGGRANGNTANGDEDNVPTICTNCSTTNTPLWRRDPEGQPLCESDPQNFRLVFCRRFSSMVSEYYY